MELRRFRADLHIHSCLSPCGELTVYPRRIVDRALEEGLDIIAVSDHNTAENAAAAIQAARGTGLLVLPGMELTSAEEVHILGIFESMAGALPAQDEVYRKLAMAPAHKTLIQDQVIVDKDDLVTGFSPRHLLAAADLDVRETVDLIHRHGGLAVASHIDREAFSIISQLGFIPPDLDLDALEISPLMTVSRARSAYPACGRFPMVRFSDAHRPEDIGRPSTDLLMGAPAFGEIRMALRKERGRSVRES
ncbi:MAG TPA: PHP domain-containing protein [Candidatus Aminicenantes bacterium]|nr:PHP domain-containing protein [Candidatus Aminicenantes bacterium]